MNTRIYDQIKKSFDLRSFEVTQVYRGNAYSIRGKGNDTYIYIRIERRSNGLCFNISNVVIDPRFQKRGILINLVNNMLKLDCIDAVIIGGVCTKEMYSWCNKYGFVQIPNSDDFIKR